MNINEKAAYLQGLLDGMKLDTSLPENKLLTQIVLLISNMAEIIEDIREETENLDEVVDDIDNALEELEEYVYGDEKYQENITDLLSEDGYDEYDEDDEEDEDEEE